MYGIWIKLGDEGERAGFPYMDWQRFNHHGGVTKAPNVRALTGGYFLTNGTSYGTIDKARMYARRILKKFPAAVLAIVPMATVLDWHNNRRWWAGNTEGERSFDFSPYMVKP